MRNNSRIIAASLFLLAIGLGGCGSGPRLRVAGDVLDRITIEHQLLLFDAENELNIAVDRRDQVVEEIAHLKHRRRTAQKKLSVAERDQEVFEAKNNPAKAQVAGLRAQAEGAHDRYLEQRLDWARSRLNLERKQLLVAKARFELAKAKLVKRNNVPGASEIELKDFEEQVKDYQNEVEESRPEVADAQKSMAQVENEWTKAVRKLQSATGGAIGSRWLD